jgi:hypothetical protein
MRSKRTMLALCCGLAAPFSAFAQAAAPTPALNSGDTAWMIVACWC